MIKNMWILLLVLVVACIGYWFFIAKKSRIYGTIIVLNGPSGSGKSSIQEEFQKLMMPDLWIKVGIDNLFDIVMPIWQSPNPIRWVQTTQDTEGNNVVTLHIGPQGKKVAYGMNSAIADYARNGCNVIVDYIAYDASWLRDLEQKCSALNIFYVAVEIPLETLEQREEARGTSPKGHARSHYEHVYGDKKYDLVVHSDTSSAQEIAQQIKQQLQL